MGYWDEEGNWVEEEPAPLAGPEEETTAPVPETQEALDLAAQTAVQFPAPSEQPPAPAVAPPVAPPAPPVAAPPPPAQVAPTAPAVPPVQTVTPGATIPPRVTISPAPVKPAAGIPPTPTVAPTPQKGKFMQSPDGTVRDVSGLSPLLQGYYLQAGWKWVAPENAPSEGVVVGKPTVTEQIQMIAEPLGLFAAGAAVGIPGLQALFKGGPAAFRVFQRLLSLGPKPLSQAASDIYQTAGLGKEVASQLGDEGLQFMRASAGGGGAGARQAAAFLASVVSGVGDRFKFHGTYDAIQKIILALATPGIVGGISGAIQERKSITSGEADKALSDVVSQLPGDWQALLGEMAQLPEGITPEEAALSGLFPKSFLATAAAAHYERTFGAPGQWTTARKTQVIKAQAKLFTDNPGATQSEALRLWWEHLFATRPITKKDLSQPLGSDEATVLESLPTIVDRFMRNALTSGLKVDSPVVNIVSAYARKLGRSRDPEVTQMEVMVGDFVSSLPPDAVVGMMAAVHEDMAVFKQTDAELIDYAARKFGMKEGEAASVLRGGEAEKFRAWVRKHPGEPFLAYLMNNESAQSAFASEKNLADERYLEQIVAELITLGYPNAVHESKSREILDRFYKSPVQNIREFLVSVASGLTKQVPSNEAKAASDVFAWLTGKYGFPDITDKTMSELVESTPYRQMLSAYEKSPYKTFAEWMINNRDDYNMFKKRIGAEVPGLVEKEKVAKEAKETRETNKLRDEIKQRSTETLTYLRGKYPQLKASLLLQLAQAYSGRLEGLMLTAKTADVSKFMADLATAHPKMAKEIDSLAEELLTEQGQKDISGERPTDIKAMKDAQNQFHAALGTWFRGKPEKQGRAAAFFELLYSQWLGEGKPGVFMDWVKKQGGAGYFKFLDEATGRGVVRRPSAAKFAPPRS